MTIDKLASEYSRQYKSLCAKIEGLRPLLYVYKGEDLVILRRKLKIYYSMASECKCISSILGSYYDEGDKNA